MHRSTQSLHKLCKEAGLRLEACGEGHYKIHGQNIVNYWPESKKRTMHIVGREALTHVTPAEAVRAAGKPPKPPVKEPEHYTPSKDITPDPVLMNAARAMQEKLGLRKP
jgi:hypothetical protein